MNKPGKTRTVAQSQTEQVHIVLPMDVNNSFSLFGGRLMEWIDIVGAVVARRHCGYQVTTASVDELNFLAPAHLGDIVVLRGRVTYVGRTSMEVCVETFVEETENWGTVRPVNRAYLTLVAVDREHKPVEVPRLELKTSGEKTDFEEAKKRVEARKKKE